ncbi:MAG: DNA polymerase III subunit alpha [candidate division Zixibacteria bacterium]|nr:DNA polymerase III subunit alpha [candidate division Zixibacteria bacterium]
MSYAPLRCHSNFSFLHGPVSLNRLLDLAERHNYRTVGLTDIDGLYGAVEFYKLAISRGIRPILGCELETEIGRCVFLAKNMTGYGNLCRLSTIRTVHRRQPSLDEITDHSRGITLIYLDKKNLRRLKEIFDDDLYLGIETFTDLQTRLASREKIRLSKEYSIKPVIADPVYFIDNDDIVIHRALSAIKNLTTIDNLGRSKLANPQAFIYSSNEMKKRCREYPLALETTLEIAEKCDVALPIGRLNFPEYINSARISNYQFLRGKAEVGLKNRYRKLSGEIYSRFESELAIINQTGFVDYFLIVSEIVEYCKQESIPVVGRGSAASSIISYALGITEIDPISQDLYFARFLNEARTDPPDIDLDLCWRRRDEVLEFVYERYGRDRVAMICTLNTFAARGGFREIAKTFGLSGDEISDFTKRLPWGHLGDLKRTRERYPECRDLPVDTEPYRTIIDLAYKIEGYPRHLSIHCGGIVISPGKLLDMVPLQMSAKGIAITQYDMRSIADLGLVKIDLLGQRGLSTIVDGQQYALKKTGSPVKYDYNDEQTLKLLRAGRTIGVFQIESPGLRSLLIEMQPQNIDDITLALALIRPGASESGMKKLFLQRLAGEKPVEYPHPSLQPVLSETMGNIIYQEQVLRSAEALAGFTPEQADLLRRSITKARDKKEFQAFARKFVAQSTDRGVPKAKARQVFQLLSQFAGYGFCKAHAATYALLSYRGCYLKAHFPIEYMAAMLNNFCGYYRPYVYADEARRFGAKLAPPNLDRPNKLCYVEDNVITIGLAFVKNLSETTMDNIIREHQISRFSSLGDFLIRVKPGKTEAESLVRLGAFDFLGGTRPSLLWYLKLYGDKIIRSDPGTLLPESLLPSEISFTPKLPDYDIDEKLAAEQEILEMAVSCHPTERLISNNGHVKADELDGLQGKQIKIFGQVIDRKRIKTGDGKLMVFLTMEDAFDYFEVTLFPEVYRKFGQRIFKKPLLDISGKVDNQHGVISIIADNLETCI